MLFRSQRDELLAAPNTDITSIGSSSAAADAENALSHERYDSTDALLEDLMGNVNQMTVTPQPSYLGHLQTKYYNQVVDQMDLYHQSSSFSHQDDDPHAVTTTNTTSTTDLQPPLLTSSLQQDAISNHHTITSNTTTTTTSSLSFSSSLGELPTDEMISKALRAYRDKHGTRQIGRAHV